MDFGIALPTSGWPDVDDVWPFERIVEFGLRAERLGFDSLWVNDHFWIELFGPRRATCPEPFVLLSYLAARTSRVKLGTLVLCSPLRSPGQLAREALALAEASSGRFILGIGAGWHEPEFTAFGIPSDRLVSRFEEYVEVLRPLLAGERVDHEGTYFRLQDASVFGNGAPPVWIAAGKPRMRALTGRSGEGWNGGGPPETWAEGLAEIRAAEAAAGRPAGSVIASGNAIAILGDEDEIRRTLEEHPPPMGMPAIGADGFREHVEEFRAAGCDHLILHFSGSIWTSYDDDQLELAAAALGLAPAAAR